MTDQKGIWARVKRTLRALGEIDQATAPEGFRDNLKWMAGRVVGLFKSKPDVAPPEDQVDV